MRFKITYTKKGDTRIYKRNVEEDSYAKAEMRMCFEFYQGELDFDPIENGKPNILEILSIAVRKQRKKPELSPEVRRERSERFKALRAAGKGGNVKKGKR